MADAYSPLLDLKFELKIVTREPAHATIAPALVAKASVIQGLLAVEALKSPFCSKAQFEISTTEKIRKAETLALKNLSPSS